MRKLAKSPTLVNPGGGGGGSVVRFPSVNVALPDKPAKVERHAFGRLPKDLAPRNRGEYPASVRERDDPSTHTRDEEGDALARFLHRQCPDTINAIQRSCKTFGSGRASLSEVLQAIEDHMIHYSA
jgi:hypothetical protein